MKKIRRWLALAVLLALPALWMTGSTADRATTMFGDNITYIMFGGSNIDSTEQAGAWVPVAGARRVIIRTWSAKAAFHASTDADSTFSDSLITFKLVFSDSSSGNAVNGGADSVLINPAVSYLDSARIMVMSRGLPINKQLRGPSNGSGLITIVSALSNMDAGVTSTEPMGFIPKKWMRVYVTPLRRMTVTGSQSTEGKRVNGLKGFRMWATVIN